MKNKDNGISNEKKTVAEPSIKKTSIPQETAEELVNAFGTYNIQPTAETENDFPAISQGLSSKMKKKCSEKVFRGARNGKPDADASDKHCF